MAPSTRSSTRRAAAASAATTTTTTTTTTTAAAAAVTATTAGYLVVPQNWPEKVSVAARHYVEVFNQEYAELERARDQTFVLNELPLYAIITDKCTVA